MYSVTMKLSYFLPLVFVILNGNVFDVRAHGKFFYCRQIEFSNLKYSFLFRCCFILFVTSLTRIIDMLCIGECPSNSPFLKNNGAEDPKVPRPIVYKEWRDTRTFSNLKSTHCTLLILLIIKLVTKKSLCIVSKVQREQ